MSNFITETKKLTLEIKENEARYISGELDLTRNLEKTEQLYKDTLLLAPNTENVASLILPDSNLIRLQTNIARQCAKAYKFDSLVFKPTSFSEKVRNHFFPHLPSKGESKEVHEVWEKLGEYSQQRMYTVPTFNFIYGTFNAEPMDPVKKKRKQIGKENIGDATKADKVNPQSDTSKDVMTRSTERVYSIFIGLTEKSELGAICFYEFVTDPGSFTRTVENIFTVSLLVKMGHMYLFEDQNGLPCLRKVTADEKREFGSRKSMQGVISITMEDWQAIVKTFKLTHALIPPKRK